MSVNRIISGIAGLSVLFSFLTLPTDCGQQKSETYKLTVNCTTTINVTSTGVDVPDAYVCKNGKVTWIANDHIFSVGFKNGSCPFQGPGACKEINNQHPSAGPIKDTTTPVVYDYGIVVDGQLFDPHIIGGG
jgi:hypothetical protein